jgi:hypothetical protein
MTPKKSRRKIRKGYRPSEEESERIDRAAMDAAISELGVISNDEIDSSGGVMAFLRAFKAIGRASDAAKVELILTKPGYDYVDHFTDHGHIVASALYAVLCGMEASECSPQSVAGEKIVMFVSAMRAVDAMQDIESSLDAYLGSLGALPEPIKALLSE